ncbi:MAG: hypothetical protein [Siphoviridae sp. ctvD11]|nr:MAG: hypothetical protein [Siphoviridae sp. ctvD11]
MKAQAFKEHELLIMYSALTITGKMVRDMLGRTVPEGKTYATAHLHIVNEIMKQFKAIIKDDKIEGTHELKLGTHEMKLILDNIEAREWAPVDADAVLAVKAKLA